MYDFFHVDSDNSEMIVKFNESVHNLFIADGKNNNNNNNKELYVSIQNHLAWGQGVE